MPTLYDRQGYYSTYNPAARTFIATSAAGALSWSSSRNSPVSAKFVTRVRLSHCHRLACVRAGQSLYNLRLAPDSQGRTAICENTATSEDYCSSSTPHRLSRIVANLVFFRFFITYGTSVEQPSCLVGLLRRLVRMFASAPCRLS